MANEVNLGNVADSVREMMKNDPAFANNGQEVVFNIEHGPIVEEATGSTTEVAENGPYTYNGPGSVVIGAPPQHRKNPNTPNGADPNVGEDQNKGPKPVIDGLEGLDLSAGPVAHIDSQERAILIDGISEEDLRAAMPAVSDEEFRKLVPEFKVKLSKYRKSLIMQGFTPEEALEATKSNMQREGLKINNDWADANPDVAEVKIDKSQEKVVSFTPEERTKMAKARTIRLVVVEDKALASIPVKKVDVKHKADYMHSLSGGLSRYSVPMPATGDFMTFRGAQIMQLASIMATEDEKMHETLMRKAQLLYDRFVGGTVIDRGDRYNSMSFMEFCNSVAYADVDMGLFGVLCAGQMEESETELTCTKCKHVWTQKYNTKALLSMDGFSDFFKGRADRILANSSNKAELAKENAIMHGAVRYQSPFSNNVYDLEMPSIAKANRVFRSTDPKDQLKLYISAIALYVNRMLIYDRENNEYLELGSSDSEIDMLLDTLLLVPDDDTRMLMEQIGENYMYTPNFKLEVTCPHCGNKHALQLSVDQMVFQRAQDFYTVTT